jgi:predicted double-glycine peptidase
MSIHLPIQPFQETLYASMCGPASLKIVLGYFGVEKSEEELAKLCNVDRYLGVNDRDIVRVANMLGFSAVVKNNASFEDIEEYLRKNIPPIVDWFTAGRRDYADSDVPDGHYSVVCGLDRDCIFLQDPEIGKIRKIARDDFLRVWFDFQGECITKDALILRQLIILSPKNLTQ